MKLMISICIGIAFLITMNTAWSFDHESEIIDTKFKYQVHNDEPYVFTIGYIKNNTSNPLEDITIEVLYFNKNKELIDVTVDNLYSMTVPANDKIAFKVQTFASSEKDQYSSHIVRIVHATQDIPYQQNSTNRKKSSYDFYTKIFISWSPVLLIVIIWVVLMRKYSGKGSNQRRIVELMERQVEFDEARNKEISNIATALKSSPNIKSD